MATVAAQPISTVMIPISKEQAFVLGSKVLNDANEVSLVVCDFQGNTTYEDTFVE